ncbi:tail fiber domain-containing protein, partial [Dellaglioa algida]|uniref:tail fiber domain-containing protein n=1 Tax=Dellaglioa algida TaxID=105612 RepID=UPI00255EA0BC|nr:tail fiber domain-containing protein [Dellaglioa algida]
MIATIKADKITAGTINAANVNLINLNANNIASGTISGINISGVTFRGTDMHLENGMTIGKNGSIKTTFDYGEKLHKAFNPRWWKGNSGFTENRIEFYANEYNATETGGAGSFLGWTETFIGPNYGKWRLYDNHTNMNLLGRVDITGDIMQISNSPSNKNSGVLLQANGDILAYSSIWSRNSVTAGNIIINGTHAIKTLDGGDFYFMSTRDAPIGIHAKSFNVTSRRSLKKEIVEYDTEKALDKLAQTDILNWKYKSETAANKSHIGVVIDDVADDYHVPKEILSDNNHEVDLNNLVGLTAAAVKELIVRNQNLENKLKKMEEVRTNEN